MRDGFYSKDPVGISPEGFPVYQYHELVFSEPRYVVQLPNGKAVYSDARGRISTMTRSDLAATAAMAAGLGGIYLAGSLGGLLGAAAGALAAWMFSGKRIQSHVPGH